MVRDNTVLVRIGPGRHAHPRSGGCLLELAGTLNGSPWTDRPACVPPAPDGSESRHLRCAALAEQWPAGLRDDWDQRRGELSTLGAAATPAGAPAGRRR